MKLHTRQHVVNDIRNSFSWVAQGVDAIAKNARAKPRVAFVSPGPPGIGKTDGALQIILADGGHIVEPSHGQAVERMIEAKRVEKREKIPTMERRHYQGMGRQCRYLPADEWAMRNWSFSDVACGGCDKRTRCASQRQFWDETPVSVGVHAMANWVRPGMMIIDEMPVPVEVETYEIEELLRLGFANWPTEIEQWRQPIEADWRRVMDHLLEVAHDTKDISSFGKTVSLSGIFNGYDGVRQCLERILGYLETNFVPMPSAEGVRRKRVKSEHWPLGNLREIAQMLLDEHNAKPMRERGATPSKANMRLWGDRKGNLLEIKLEIYRQWKPPTHAHVVLDSTAAQSQFVYERLYAGYELQFNVRDIALDPDHVELIQYPTKGFSRTRSLTDWGGVSRYGANSRIRGLRELLNQVRLAQRSAHDVIEVGIIDHRNVLEELGFPVDEDNPVARVGRTMQQSRTCKAEDPLLEATLSELESVCRVVVGYHGGVIGSNAFQGNRILAVFGDPFGHVGMWAEEAAVLELPPQQYIDWKVGVAATQEIYRARLLDADAANKKTVMYFGNHAPAVDGVIWETRSWKEGGRLPSHQSWKLLNAVYARASGKRLPFLGSISPELCELHATLIGAPVLALRESGEIIDEISFAARESYRRAAKEAAITLGYSAYSMKNPMGDRRALTIWAESREDAEMLHRKLSLEFATKDPRRAAHVEKFAEERDRELETFETLAAKRDEIIEKVRRAQLGYALAKRTGDKDVMAAARAQQRKDLRAAMIEWRAIRTEWRRRRPTESLQHSLEITGFEI